jgi:hypothetical protein
MSAAHPFGYQPSTEDSMKRIDQLALVVAVLCLAISVQAQRTTTHTDETSNNTSGCASTSASYVLPSGVTNPCTHSGTLSTFPGANDDLTAGIDRNTSPNTVVFDLAPSNLSDKTHDGPDIHTIVNGGASKVFANIVLWHGGPGNNGTWDYVAKANSSGTQNSVQNSFNGHLLNSYANNDSNEVKTQIAFMQRLNIDGIVANPPGPLPDTFTGESQKNKDVNAAFLKWKSEADNTSSFLFSVMTDHVMWEQNCPGGQDSSGNWLVTPACVEKIMICSLDYMNTATANTFTCASDSTTYSGGGIFADSHYWKVSDGTVSHPVMSYFMDESKFFNNCSGGCAVYDDNLNDKTCTTSAQCWDDILGGINHHISGFSVRPYVIYRDSFTKHSTLGPSDGSFRWFNPSTDQTVEDIANYTGDSCAYNCWLSSAASNSSKVALGVALAKVDHAQSHFSTQSAIFGSTADHILMDARCGITWLDYLQTPHNSGAGGTNAALNAIEIATWDDYDEGTEMETGVDNCISSFTISLSGTTLSWTISFNSPGDESTIDHYAIFYSTDGSTGQNITELADVSVNHTGSYSYSLPNTLPSTTVLYVKAVGKAMITNHMTSGVTCTVCGSTLTTERPTTATANGVAYTNPGNAEDGNLSTSSNGVSSPSQQLSGEIWSGFTNISGATSVKLKVSSAANCATSSDGIELNYSLDGGSTWNLVYIMGLFGGSCVNRTQQTDIITLSNSQDLTQVKVLALFSSTGSSSHQVYDVWLEVTH